MTSREKDFGGALLLLEWTEPMARNSATKSERSELRLRNFDGPYRATAGVPHTNRQSSLITIYYAYGPNIDTTHR